MTIIEVTDEQAQLIRDAQLPVDVVDPTGQLVGRLEPCSEETARAVDAILRARRDQPTLEK
jgi:hypothetical protein